MKVFAMVFSFKDKRDVRFFKEFCATKLEIIGVKKVSKDELKGGDVNDEKRIKK